MSCVLRDLSHCVSFGSLGVNFVTHIQFSSAAIWGAEVLGIHDWNHRCSEDGSELHSAEEIILSLALLW